MGHDRRRRAGNRRHGDAGFLRPCRLRTQACPTPKATPKFDRPSATSADDFRPPTSAASTRQRGYPEEFVDALTKAGWLAALIPEEYGGSGLNLTEASVIMEEINRSGGNAGACHGQMYNMGTLLRHGSEEQKRPYLPRIASGELRLQSMGVTEPTTGTDTTKIKTTAVREGDRYVVNGQKVWISRVQHSDSDDPPCADDAAAGGDEEVGRAVDLSRGSAGMRLDVV